MFKLLRLGLVNKNLVSYLYKIFKKLPLHTRDSKVKMSMLGKVSRLTVALGGFLTFVGVMMVVISVFAFFDVVDVATDPKHVNLFMWFLLVIGVLLLVSGIVFVRVVR